jgi:hypothetical protein
VDDKVFLGEGLERAVPVRFDKESKVAVSRWKHGDDCAALIVIVCTIDVLANRDPRHRKLLSGTVDANISKIGKRFLTDVPSSSTGSPWALCMWMRKVGSAGRGLIADLQKLGMNRTDGSFVRILANAAQGKRETIR